MYMYNVAMRQGGIADCDFIASSIKADTFYGIRFIQNNA